MRIVLDTNVVVSALLWGGTPYRLIQAAVSDGTLKLYTSPALLAELSDVLIRAHLVAQLGRQSSSMDQVMSLYGDLTIRASPAAVPRVVPGDPDDDHVIAAAIAAKADLIVSGDRHLLKLRSHTGIQIVTPAEALARLSG